MRSGLSAKQYGIQVFVIDLTYVDYPELRDIVLSRYKTAVLVQGCFWHGHSCHKGQTRPASNREFWDRKLDGNVQRDTRNQTNLREMGWTVVLIWECLLREGTSDLLEHLFREREAFSKCDVA